MAELEGWGGINHAEGQVEDEEQGVGGKQLKSQRKVFKGVVYTKSLKMRGHRTSGSSNNNNNNKVLDGLTGNAWSGEE